MAVVALALLSLWPGCRWSPLPQCPPQGDHLVIATTDFEAGALATVDGPACIGDRWSSLGPDPLVRAVDGDLLVLDRAGGDRVRLFEPGQYTEPTHDFSPGVSVNLHDVIAVDGQWWFAPYERSAILRTDMRGELLGEIDLSVYADEDGLPEIDRLVVRGDTVYASLQRLDRTESWTPREGMVIGLSDAGSVVSDAEIGPNPKLYPDPSDPETLLALTGQWYQPDGALVRYDPRSGAVQTLLTEARIGADLGAMAGVGPHLVLLLVDENNLSHLLCYDLDTGELIEGTPSEAWFVDAVAAEDTVYVAVRTGWEDELARELWSVDPMTCEETVIFDSFTLDPYTMAYLPSSDG